MAIQITNEYREAYVEVIEVLRNMDKKYVEQIPQKLKDFLIDNCSKDYVFKLNLDKPLQEQNLKDKTLSILGMINLNYWCKNQATRKKLLRQYYQAEMLYQTELRKKYNPENIFKRKSSYNNTEEEVMSNKVNLVKQNENLFKRFLNKLRKIFKI